MGSYFRDFYSPKATQRPTVGDTKFSVINQDHMGWLNCDGRGLSTTTYNILFQTIGYSFGGSGDTFNLPDARGKVPGAVGDPTATGELTPALNPQTWQLGDVSGNQLHILTIPEMPSHNHGTDVSGSVVGNNRTGNAGTHNHTGVTGAGGNQTESELVGGGSAANVSGSGSHTHTIPSDGDHYHTIATQGGDDPHNNMQPTIFIGNMFIFSGKYGAGYFPYAANTNIF